MPTTSAGQGLRTMQNAVGDFRSYREIADGFFKTGLYQQAAPYYEAWIQAQPKDTAAYLIYARCLMRIQQPEKSLEVLNLAVQAGYAFSKTLLTEQDFATLQARPEFKNILAACRRNEALATEFPLRYLQQTRIGRYAILYPSGYTSTQQYHLLLLLHGNGQEPAIMLRWAKELALSDVIIICPEAPYSKSAESIAQGKMRFSAAGEELGLPDSLRSMIVEESAAWYLAVLEDAQKHLPVYKEAPMIAGFSQGGFYTNVLLARQPQRFCGAILLSASHYSFGGIEERLDAVKKAGVPLLHAHGKQDPIVPFKTAEYIEEQYAKHGILSTFIPYDGIHWMNAELTRKVAEWIKLRYKETYKETIER